MEAQQLAEVDFRFAGAEDAAEIVALVNSAFSVEKGDSASAFTTRDRVNKEEVHACLQGGGEKRWLVLETPHPEENMAAACLIYTGSTPGTGSVEILAVDPARQGEGLGAHMLRRAEGILLNFRCRFVRIRVPQWREDVLGWASKRGYKETGGGLWGELDGESAADLTRPTRYFVLTRDLLTDKKVVGTFGDGTARFTAATAAAAERTAVAHGVKSAPKPKSNDIPRAAKGASVASMGVEDDSGRLAGFLSTVLKGLTDAKGEDEGESGEKGAPEIPAAPMADMALGPLATPSSTPEALLPPLPPTASKESGDLSEEFDMTELQCAQGDVDTADGEESVEDLLSSLMRTLNTEQGRADFRLLASNGSTS